MFDYELDLTGTSPANRITEVHTIQTRNTVNSNKVITPRNGPFYLGTGMYRVSVTNVNSGDPIDFGVGFICTDLFLEYTLLNPNAKLYRSITLNDRNISGPIQIEFQTIGGPLAISDVDYLKVIANSYIE